MATAQDYLKQIQAMGPTPSSMDLKQQVTQAYENPILKPLVNETANLSAQYLPSLFEPFTRMGTGAGDMSPAAKLAMIGGSLGRLNSRIEANNKIGNYYGAQIGDVAQGIGQNWQNQNDSLWKLYQAASQKEQFDQQMRLQQAQINAMNQAPQFPTYTGAVTTQPTGGVDKARLGSIVMQAIKNTYTSGNTNLNSPIYQTYFQQLRALGLDPMSMMAKSGFTGTTTAASNSVAQQPVVTPTSYAPSNNSGYPVGYPGTYYK